MRTLALIALITVACGPRVGAADAGPAASDGPALPTTAEALAEALEEVVGAPGHAGLRALCTAAFRDASGSDSCSGLYQQARDKELRFRTHALRREPAATSDRAVIVFDVVRTGRVVDRVFVYASHGGGRWLADGIDESEGHLRAFLAGAVGGTFRAEALPSSPDLDKLAADYLGLVTHMAETGKDLDVVLGGGIRDAVKKLAAMDRPRATRSFILVDWHVGALAFEDAGGERLFVYVERKEGAWTPFDAGYGSLSAQALLDRP